MYIVTQFDNTWLTEGRTITGRSSKKKIANLETCCAHGGGGTLIFSYIRRNDHFGGSNLLISIFVWIFRKMKIFWGMKICGYFFGVIPKLE